MKHHPVMESIVDILSARTQNTERLFFRTQLAYFLGVVASHMRVSISGWANSKLPVNVYAVNVSPSGTGKGYSTAVIENELLDQFKEVFLKQTLPQRAQEHIVKMAGERALRNGTEEEEELQKLKTELRSAGAVLFNFDSATSPAIKQFRHRLLLSNAGGLNLQIDEIGANLSNNIEPLHTFLELYDKGHVKEKLIKSSAENIRTERLDGATPANMLLFGVPSKLLDGGETEKKFIELLDMGFGRRCFFGYTEQASKNLELTAEELLDQMFDTTSRALLESLTDQFARLADIHKMNTVVLIERPECTKLMQYKLDCEAIGRTLGKHEAIRKAEIDHRYFKVLKLAGAYAFFEGSPCITSDHIDYAISLAEESGESLAKLVNPVRPYVKLARYLAEFDGELTLADLDNDLPCFRGTRPVREEMITMATSWGVKNNIVIKKTFIDGIQFISGTTIERTDLDKCILTYSKDMTTGYINRTFKFDDLHQVMAYPNQVLHWLNHQVRDEYRLERNVITGFNLLVLDVDNSCPMSTAQMLLKDYKFLMYTTKSHGIDDQDRYRIILPMNYELHLDEVDYKKFMTSIFQALPFAVDEAGNHRCKKWETFPGTTITYNDGMLFDVLPFIPRTTQSEQQDAKVLSQSNLDNLERWVINNIGDGNRNVQLHKYAMALGDAGKAVEHIRLAVFSLNDKLPDKLTESELYATIMQSVYKKFGV